MEVTVPLGHLGDVLGSVLALRPELATVRTLPIRTEMWGETLRTVIDATGSGRPVQVVLTTDAPRFREHFLASMERALKAPR